MEDTSGEVFLQASFSVGDGWRFECESPGWSVGPFLNEPSAERWLGAVSKGDAPVIAVNQRMLFPQRPEGTAIPDIAPEDFRRLLSDEVRPVFESQFGR